MYNKILNNSKYIKENDVNKMLDEIGDWSDLTFKFFSDGSVRIIDNNTEQELMPKDLTGVCLDYYVRKRIEMIKTKIYKSA